MSESEVSVMKNQQYYNIPEHYNVSDLSNSFLPETQPYPSVTNIQSNETITFGESCPQRVFDPKSGLQLYVLNVAKDTKAIDDTEGALAGFAKKLDEEKIEPVDLVKRAWKTSEHDAR